MDNQDKMSKPVTNRRKKSQQQATSTNQQIAYQKSQMMETSDYYCNKY